jgi:predicted aconitase with swiveling domain
MAAVSVLVIVGDPVVPGTASGEALVAREPLSFWGGYDATSGAIIDRRHPLFGSLGAGRVLVLPFSRGSSTTTAVLLESIRAGTAPAAIITTGRDTFFALASIVAAELYGRSVPVVAVSAEDSGRLASGDLVSLTPDGTLHVSAGPERAEPQEPS